jgi:hypothetical protein
MKLDVGLGLAGRVPLALYLGSHAATSAADWLVEVRHNGNVPAKLYRKEFNPGISGGSHWVEVV